MFPWGWEARKRIFGVLPARKMGRELPLPAVSFSGSRPIFRAGRTPKIPFFAPKPHGNACYAGYWRLLYAAFTISKPSWIGACRFWAVIFMYDFTHLACGYAKLLEQKKVFWQEKSLTLTRLIWFTNMATVSMIDTPAWLSWRHVKALSRRRATEIDD